MYVGIHTYTVYTYEFTVDKPNPNACPPQTEILDTPLPVIIRVSDRVQQKLQTVKTLYYAKI